MIDNGGHAFEDVGFRVVVLVGIVRADHDHGHFRFQSVKLAVLETPEDVLRAIPADAQVEALASAVILAPDIFARAFPALRDGIANKGDVVFARIVHRALQDVVRAFAGVQRGNDGGVCVDDDDRGRIGRDRRVGLRLQRLAENEAGEAENDQVVFGFHKYGPRFAG